jgi:hypothetical protein
MKTTYQAELFSLPLYLPLSLTISRCVPTLLSSIFPILPICLLPRPIYLLSLLSTLHSLLSISTSFPVYLSRLPIHLRSLSICLPLSSYLFPHCVYPSSLPTYHPGCPFLSSIFPSISFLCLYIFLLRSSISPSGWSLFIPRLPAASWRHSNPAGWISVS